MSKKLSNYLPAYKYGAVFDKTITSGSSNNFDFSGSTGTFKSSTGTNTLGGDVVISGSKTLTTGTGAVSLNGTTTVAANKTLAVTTADLLTVGGVIVPQHIEVSYRQNANASLADEAFFVANRAYQVVAVSEVHSAAGTDGGAVNLQVTKDTSTDAPGAGTDLLTNNTNAGFNLKGTANTVQNGTLTATAASLQLAAGDRLSVDFAGTLTTLAGVVVTVTLKRI